MHVGIWGQRVSVKKGLRWVAVICATLVVLGCAEFRKRGGLVGSIEDKILFAANAKSHRVLRSYVIVGALTAIASNRGIPTADKSSFGGRMDTTLDVVNEAFVCAYQSSNGCIFFDEKMSRLDYSIYKLALTVLFDAETTQLVAQLSDKLIGEIPIVGPSLKTTAATAQAVGHAATAVNQTTQVVDSLVQLGKFGISTGAQLLPLYRDAVEMDMVVVLDYLTRQCSSEIHDRNGSVSQAMTRPGLARFLEGKNASSYDLPNYDTQCADFARGYQIYFEGNGDLGQWSDFTKEMNIKYLFALTPSADHFIEVSRLIAASCTAILSAAPKPAATSSEAKATEAKTLGTTPAGPTQCVPKILFQKQISGEDLSTVAFNDALRLRRGVLPAGKP
jgi:hypothetical protein